MNQPSDVLSRFYDSFKACDYAGMQACYHSEALFSDPVFPSLKASQAKAMWHMLIESGSKSGLSITYELKSTVGNIVSARWTAHYAFGPHRRQVVNVIDTEMVIQDGLIITQTDSFDFWRWAGMALGFSGRLLGWTGYLKNKVRKTVARRLADFISRHPEYQQ